jgi:hypothetical protein
MLNLQSVYFGQKHKDFDNKDYDIIRKVSRLAKKHQQQCVNSCNGEGFVNGQRYYSGMIDDYAQRTYGQNVKSAYFDDSEESIFDIEAGKIEDKINKLVYQFNYKKYALWRVKPLKIEYQGDPRGNTVKLFYENDYIEL